MTVDQLLRLAIQIGAKPHSDPERWGHLTISHEDVERFAALVAAHEREECAKIANEWQTDVLNPQYHCDCATAIRARGKK
jgi:hypothetical protein